jgi:hypothetical protein
MFKSNKTVLAASADYDDIVRWFDSQNPAFKKKAKIVSNEDLGLSDLFRIDKVVQKYYYPRMPRTAYANENQDVPRISMSSSLMGYLAVSKIPYSKWLKFMMPLFLIWTALGCLFMLGALMIGY